MKLTPEEMERFNQKKLDFMQTYTDIAFSLDIDPVELVKAKNGIEVTSEVVQAVREWIA